MVQSMKNQFFWTDIAELVVVVHIYSPVTRQHQMLTEVVNVFIALTTSCLDESALAQEFPAIKCHAVQSWYYRRTKPFVTSKNP